MPMNVKDVLTMNHMSREMLFLAVGASLLAFRGTEAQTRQDVPTPVRIRYSLPSSTGATEAVVLAEHGDSLWVRRLAVGDTVALSLSSLTHLDVSVGKVGHKVRGAGIGLLAGVAGGGILALTEKDEVAPNCTGCDPAATKVAWDVGSFAVLGVALGTIAGALMTSDRWVPVFNAIATGPPTRGRVYDAGIRIRVF